MSKPVRLHKQPEDKVSPFLNKIEMKIEDWVWKHAHILLPIFIIILMFLFVAICYVIIGVSATDSGVQYNQFERII